MYVNPSLEYKQISEWLAAEVNKPTTPKKFVRKLSKHLNSTQHPVRIKLIANNTDSLDPGQFSFGGEYDPDLDERDRKQFIIEFITTLGKDTPWLLTQEDVHELSLELTELIVHEYEHQRQYRKRRYRLHNNRYSSDHEDYVLRREQEYFGDPDEIDAYAMNIAARFYLLRYVLNTTSKYTCYDLKRYVRVFGRRHNVVKLLINKINENIRYFKDNDNGKNHRRACKRPRVRRL